MSGAKPSLKVAVCGAGAMGCGIAQLAATAGATVKVPRPGSPPDQR